MIRVKVRKTCCQGKSTAEWGQGIREEQITWRVVRQAVSENPQETRPRPLRLAFALACHTPAGTGTRTHRSSRSFLACGPNGFTPPPTPSPPPRVPVPVPLSPRPGPAGCRADDPASTFISRINLSNDAFLSPSALSFRSAASRSSSGLYSLMKHSQSIVDRLAFRMPRLVKHDVWRSAVA